MKYFFFLTTLIVAMSIAHSLPAQTDVFSSPVIGTLVFDHQKGYRLAAIDESPGRTMDAALFPATDPETIKKYMPEGGAPASISSFVLFTGEDTIFFDTGNGGELWVKKLTDLGVKPESVKHIFLTHMHGDHIGGLLELKVTPLTAETAFNEQVRRFPSAKLLCTKQEYEHGFPPNVVVPTADRRRNYMIKEAYGRDFTTFNFDDVVYENSEITVKALDAAGHTPGHTAFLIEPKDIVQGAGAKEKVLIIGDLLHAAALQFPVPEACARFDMDHEKAIASRKRLLDFAAQEKIPVVGMHLPPPHIGIVKKNDQGSYIWEP